MGPIVTAEFLKTIYEYHPFEREQDAPNVIVFSLPSAPDRSSSIHGRNEAVFVDFMIENLAKLDAICDRIVISCCTAHFALPHVPAQLREKVISLIGVVGWSLATHHENALLLATTGTYQKRLFQEDCSANDRIIPLKEEDQHLIHKIIYETLKPGLDPLRILPDIDQLLDKYQTRSFISGCTEFHLLAKVLAKSETRTIHAIDPLSVVARDFGDLFSSQLPQTKD